MEQSTGRTDSYWSVSRLVNRLELIMRIRFVSYLGMGIISAFLIVGSYAFTEGTFMWLPFAGGIILAAIGAIGFISSRRRLLAALPAALIAVAGAVMAVLAVTLTEVDVDNAAFGISIATGILSVLGLWAHELATEDDVRTLASPPITP